jgi:hypothetical protein
MWGVIFSFTKGCWDEGHGIRDVLRIREVHGKIEPKAVNFFA